MPWFDQIIESGDYDVLNSISLRKIDFLGLEVILYKDAFDNQYKNKKVDDLWDIGFILSPYILMVKV